MAVLIALASKLVAGSVSIFNFAWNLQNVPLALIGLSFSVAAFPTLVDYFTKHDHENFLKQIIAPARQIIFWSIPVVIFFIVLRAHIVRVILGAGEFSWNDTRLTAAALALFVVSVTFQSLVLLLVRGYYAAGKTWRPFIITCMSGCISIGSAFLFLHLFQTQEGVRVFIESLLRVSGVPGTSVLMLGLAYTLGEALRFFIMWFLFKKEFMRGYSMSLQKVFLQTLTASVFMGGVIYQLLQLFNTVLDINTFHGVFLQGFLSGSIGLCVFILVLKILKNEEIEAIEHALRAKGFWRVPFMGGGKDALS
jgi:putative peptidoglycan lipid II flippase